MEIVNKKKAAAKAELPVWAYRTPCDKGYTLTMWECGHGGQEEQGLDITRAEFIALKEYLAALRGFANSAEDIQALREADEALYDTDFKAWAAKERKHEAA